MKQFCACLLVALNVHAQPVRGQPEMVKGKQVKTEKIGRKPEKPRNKYRILTSGGASNSTQGQKKPTLTKRYKNMTLKFYGR